MQETYLKWASPSRAHRVKDKDNATWSNEFLSLEHHFATGSAMNLRAGQSIQGQMRHLFILNWMVVYKPMYLQKQGYYQ